MNIIERAIAGVGLLLLALALQLDRILDRIKAAAGLTPKRGIFEVTELKLNLEVPGIPRRTKFAIAGLAAFALGACFLAFHNPVYAAVAVGLMGAAGSFARTVPLNAPLPIYSVLGVYTGGSSDTSPTSIALPTAFAALCVALGIAPTPTVLVVQAIGNVTAGPFLTATNANLVLTYTTSGSGLTGFVATVGCQVPNTLNQP
jgi:hypothetical protein